MAFRLKLGEPIEQGFRRIAVEQIERAQSQIRAKKDPAAEVHEARKCMKRIRALLRLGREGLGDDVFRAENARFRLIGLALAPARDDHVMIETIVKLMTSEEVGHATHALARLKAAILVQRAQNAISIGTGLAETDTELERALRRVRRWQITPDCFSTLERGLVRNYRRGLARRQRAYQENTDEAFHDWRKSVQALWRHMSLVSKAWPAHFDAHVALARELSQILGDDHDLAILREKMRALPPSALSLEDRQEIESLLETRQQALRLATKPRGDMLFSERPKAHGRRIATVWKAAVERDPTDDLAEEPEVQKRPRAKTAAPARG
ncbi:CHAD domain-containing protein [Hyphomicrobium sp.]|uniref:CHAD domain-containing protein n=1 Tax=Hyphomicrobium sp. TaxID=82 RepID=UPI002E2FE3B8|nr:CHAD domain-containing protein [Hyphomicrobium sp.]HEX2842955.1 CHAD domain-containing protein [Hyphomicrobium sp.]